MLMVENGTTYWIRFKEVVQTVIRTPETGTEN